LVDCLVDVWQSGKTHTMMGAREAPGLYLLAAEEIFDIVHSGRHGSLQVGSLMSPLHLNFQGLGELL
jgi:hypothetical protein